MPFIVAVSITAAFVIGLVVNGMWPHFFGATEADIASVNLAQPAKALAKSLPAARTSSDKEVKVEFRHSVIGFEQARFTFSAVTDHVSGMRLVFEREEKNGKSERGDRSYPARLESRLPGVEQSQREWGFVRFDVTEHDIGFRVKDVNNNVANEQFDKQVEAARQVLLAIAFDDEPKLSAKEIADTLGSGYAVADVAQVDVSMPKKQALEAIRTRFPGSLFEADQARVPLTHPLVRDVVIRWKTGWNDTREYLHASFHMTSAYDSNRASLAKCIAGQPASSSLDARVQDLDVRDERLDPATFASIMHAVDVCR